MNGFKDFLRGIYGFDGLSCGLVFLGILINLVTAFAPYEAMQKWNIISFIPLLICIFRFFSHNHEKRTRENMRFIQMMHTLFDYFDKRGQKKEQSRIFKFFKCNACGQKIRVPRGKGKIEITCPKCGNKFIKKT